MTDIHSEAVRLLISSRPLDVRKSTGNGDFALEVEGKRVTGNGNAAAMAIVRDYWIGVRAVRAADATRAAA